MKKGPEWSIKVRWDKNVKPVPAEVNLMKKYTSKGLHPFDVMTYVKSLKYHNAYCNLLFKLTIYY